MYQQSLDLRDRLSEQLSLNIDVPEKIINYNDLGATDSFINLGTITSSVSSYITVNNVNGDEGVRIGDTGLSLRIENKTWLKTKVANWLGVQYL